ncbi:MAG: mismatch repair protein, partial [Acidobacteriota bacterium]
VMRALVRARAAVTYYADGEARIEDRWMRDEPSGERFRDRDHPYADDLDVFGPRSLFQLLSSARTPMGEERLAGWLLRPSPIAAVHERQSRVAALRERLDLRERIAVVNAGRRRALHTERLIEWAEQRSSLPPMRLVVVVMALLFVAAFANYMYGGRGIFLVIVPVINLALLGWLGKRGNAVVESLAGATESAALELIANVIAQIEREPFSEPELIAIASRLKRDDPSSPVSKRIARLARSSDWADSRHNVFLRLSEIPLLFTLHLAYAAESWRARNGSHVRDWIDAVGEMEALLSLAAYSYEHPDDPFAELVESSSALFEAVEAAHPLLPAAVAVRNTVVLKGPSILIVSGSNMAGKSTLMRTVGINAVLALAGAPVRAQRLRLTPLAIGTCLRHSDSLQEHRSGFYTEALRIRLICDLLDGPLPLLFLFDELLSGTNSKDRRIAAEGVVRTMLSRRAIGMITTHDLALTEIADMCPGDVKNVHLEDRVENGRMSFDYKLRDGVITHSNALELMRIIGLDV